MEKPNLSFLQIEPTTVCNYTCGFCVGRHMPQKNMALETFTDAVSAVKGLKYVSIQGEGEPLLNHDFFEMVRIVKSLHPEVSISFITNGSLFSLQNIREILVLGIDRIMVSIESANDHMFKEIRGGKLSKVKAGISLLLEERNKVELSRPVIGFASTIMNSTYMDFKGVADLYRELNMDGGISYQYLQQMSSYYDIYSQEMKGHVMSHGNVSDFEKIIAGDERYLKLKIDAYVTSFYAALYDSRGNGCPWLESGLYVNMNGISTGCCMIKNTTLYGLGKLTSENVANVFEKRSKMQEQLLHGVIPPACEGCQTANAVKNAYQANLLDHKSN
jgi:MoaA/NifB/PqqE/SkfB family radical SAM enzyme